MLSTDIPTKFQVAFASGAGVGFITQPVPLAAQSNGRASLTTGFSELNFDPLASGGIPPWGKDFNGLMYQVTAWLRWSAAGGLPVGFDAVFSGAIGGYPTGAFIKAAAGNHFWISTADNNLTDPDSGGVGWIQFPDVIVQKQAGNYAEDTGTANNYVVALNPAPASMASIIGSPIRVKAAGANTIINPVIHINGFTGVTMINTSGNPLGIGQISRVGAFFEGFFDGTFFQIAWPTTQAAAGPFVTGCIYLWPTEIAPLGTLECNGALLAASDYPALFNVLKFTYGGNGVDHFRLPDYRGLFPRGWDHGRGLDPSASMRTDRGDGTTGDHNGTNQGYATAIPAGTGVTIQNPRFGFPAWTDNNTHISYQGVPDVAFGPDANDWSNWLSIPDVNLSVRAGNTTPPNVWFNTGTPSNSFAGLGFERDLGKEPFIGASKITGTMTLDGPETRPVNINTMYIIAY